MAEELAVPTHSAFTGGPVGDRLLVKHDGTPENFRAEAAVRAPDTRVHVLPPLPDSRSLSDRHVGPAVRLAK